MDGALLYSDLLFIACINIIIKTLGDAKIVLVGGSKGSP